ncbi:hypothetical protein RND71_000941 [Anisodus tanguticus]|uniref:Rad4/PNGase transglutaminase-like fold domain-containing protein n=1 Tax=Anisodus tanguticus TaxID=243964 RepID=A0AAE1SYA3_9SOLA|nr:hypothetical protein RND71_000941 [Anisodus tanguticus]
MKAEQSKHTQQQIEQVPKNGGSLSHNDSTFDTDDGFEVLKYQLFSLTSVPPDQQKILGRDDQIVSVESDLTSISDKLRLVSIDGVEEEIAAEAKEKSEKTAMSDEELARILQAEEALMMQHFVASENKQQVEQRIRPYVNQVQMYEDLHRQEMARKTVPVDKLEEKALVSLGRFSAILFSFSEDKTYDEPLTGTLTSQFSVKLNDFTSSEKWKKSLNYVFANAKDGVHDVTKRYTRKWPEVLSRRNIISEPALAAILSDITRELRKKLSAEVISALEERNRTEMDVIERELYSKDDASVSLPGRLSEDKEWRIARSEFVSDEKNSLSSSSCPVRRCIDDHVTKITVPFPLFFQS